MNETRREYLKRMNIVIDFIEKNLEVNLSLELLAEKANYSPFHFHRVFLTVVNERVNEFIQRKRLERIASILLVDTNTPLKEFAYTYGFNSDNSFSRAFKKNYGVSPTRFKSEGKRILSKIGIEPYSAEKYICTITETNHWIQMNAQIKIEELSAIHLACISHIGEFHQVENMFQKLMKWGDQKGIIAPHNFKAVTIYHDNPNVTPTSKIRFSAGITISKNIEPEGEIRPFTVAKGLYAVARFKIHGEDISRAWKSMCIWLIDNGYEFRDADFFEMYHNDHQTDPEHKFILDICIPLTKTEKMNVEKLGDINLANNLEINHQNSECLDYHDLINYMKELRAYFKKEYDTFFKLGSIYKESAEYSYFSLTTTELRKQKIKFVIILNLKQLSFSICLSGQNKSVRKKYWELFKNSDWNKYHLAESINNSLSILDHTIVEKPNFEEKRDLTEQIEKASMKFIHDLREVLEV